MFNKTVKNNSSFFVHVESASLYLWLFKHDAKSGKVIFRNMNGAERSKQWRVKQKNQKGKVFNLEEALRMRMVRIKRKQKQLKFKPEMKKSMKMNVNKKAFVKVPDVEPGQDSTPPPSPLNSPTIVDDPLEDPEFLESTNCHENLVFKHPATIIVAGPSSSGKTVFTTKVLQNRDKMFDKKIDEVIWCYGCKTQALDTLQEKLGHDVKLRLHKGLPDIDKLRRMDHSINRCLVIDDLMIKESKKDKQTNVLTDLFVRGSHHYSMSCFYLVQNVFAQNKDMRTVYLNSMYKILFQSPGDQTQITTINSRMFPGHPRFLQEAMEDATQHQSHGYLVIDVHPRTDNRLRVRSQVFPGEQNIIYRPSD